MTVVSCRKIGDYAVIVSDCLIVQSGSTGNHEKIPLGFYLDEIFPPEIWQHPAKGLIQKVKIIGDKIAIGIAGTAVFGISFQKHLGENITSIGCIDDLKDFFQNSTDYLGRDFQVTGIFLESGSIYIFYFDFVEREFSLRESSTIGTGTELANRLQNLPSFRRKELEDGITSVSQQVLCSLGMMLGKELFSDEPAINTVGGSYIAYLTNGQEFIPLPDATFIFWAAQLAENKEISKQSTLYVLNSKKVDGAYLVRVLAHGTSEEKPNGQAHLEVKMDQPYLIEAPLKNSAPSIEKLIREAKENFTASNYIFSFSISYQGVCHEGAFIYSHSDQSPIKFKGDVTDHWGYIDPDIYRDAIDISVSTIDKFLSSR